MKGREFVRRARRYARQERLEFWFDPGWSKGSHGSVHIDGYFTTAPQHEIGAGLLSSMLKDLLILLIGKAF